MKSNTRPKQSEISHDPAKLRRQAEQRLPDPQPAAGQHGTEADTQRLVHELQVHQIQLMLQNEELQRARDEMEVALEKYSDLFDFAPVGYLILDPKGIIKESNLAGSTLLGIVRSELVNRRFGLFVAPADRSVFDTFLQKVFASTVRQSCEVAIKVEDQPALEVEMEAAAFESGQACRMALTDITELRRAEADRLILNKLESTGILAGGLAHDFNNLLTTILLNLGLAQERTPPALAHLLQEVMNAAETACALTKQLITFSNGGAPVRKLIRLSGVIQESVRSTLSGSRVRCEFSLADDLWPVEADAGQIGQVIRNMILNALEAMPEGGAVSIRAENVILESPEDRSLQPGDYVRMSIADRGGGIARDVLPKIFDPYFSTKQRGDQKGMGLGLTICHAVIQKHGGAIAVESEKGIGTTFHILLPASWKLLGNQKASIPKILSRPGRILVMDDEEGMRKAVGALLHRISHDVELVEDGQKAIEVYERARNEGRPFDAVILDLTIRGGMGGQETVLALRRIDPATKAIVMSGYTGDPVMVEPERYGFGAALEKPFDIRTLREALSLVLES